MISSRLLPGWTEAPLDELLASLETGTRPHGGVKAIAAGVPSLGGEHLDGNGGFRFERVRYVPWEFFEKMQRGRIRIGDVLVVKDGATTGKVSLVRNDFPYDPAVVNEHVFICRPVEGVSPAYLFYFLSSSEGQRRVLEYFRGSAQGGITQTFASGTLVPLAPEAEQSRIVAAIEEHFSRIDAGVESLQRARRNLQRMRAALLQAAVTGRLVPTESEIARSRGLNFEPASRILERAVEARRILWLNGAESKTYREPRTPSVGGMPVLPEGWTYASLDQLLVRPLSNGRSVPDGTEGFPVLRLTALKAGSIDVRERKIGAWSEQDAKPYLVSNGDFLVARGNGSISLVGRGGLVELDPGLVAYPDTMIRVRVNRNCSESRFLRLIWDSHLVRSQIEGAARTTAGIYKINQETLRALVLPMPPLAEQERIVDETERHLSALATTADAVTHHLTRAGSLRRAILLLAFAGRLVPQDPSDEPASALLDLVRSAHTAVDSKPRRLGRRSTK